MPTAEVETNTTNQDGAVSKIGMVNEFIGKLSAVDKENQTVSIITGGPGTAPDLFYLTPETKLYSGDQPASLDAVIPGQYIRYNFRKEGDKLQLTVLRWMPHTKPAGNN